MLADLFHRAFVTVGDMVEEAGLKLEAELAPYAPAELRPGRYD